MTDREVLTALGERLRARRHARGLTQETLAAKTGYTVQYISQAESGLRNLPLLTVNAIGRALDCEIADLFQSKDSAQRDEQEHGITAMLARQLMRLPGPLRTEFLGTFGELIRATRRIERAARRARGPKKR